MFKLTIKIQGFNHSAEHCIVRTQDIIGPILHIPQVLISSSWNLSFNLPRLLFFNFSINFNIIINIRVCFCFAYVFAFSLLGRLLF